MMSRRIYAFLLVLVAGFTACSKDEVPEPSVPVHHTMLLYMPGQDLMKKGFYEQNIKGIEKAVEAERGLNSGRLLVCYQPESHDRATLLEITYDRKKRQTVRKELKIYENFQAENPTSVRNLFTDAQQLARAESYGLTIGCHGLGWVPAGAPLPLSYLPDEPMPGALVTRSGTRAIGDSGHQLDISQLADVVAGLPYRFDYLIFDGCFMANIETLYDLRDAFDYVIASPCEILGFGFPYERTIPYLFAAGQPDLQNVCHEFWYFYQYDWDTVPNNVQSGCISMAVTSELEALATIVAEIQSGATQPCNPLTLQYYEGMSRHVFYDFGDYIRAICTDENLYARFEEQLRRAFPEACRLHTPSFYSAYNARKTAINTYSGVSTSEPSQQYADLYQETAWYRRTHAGQ